MVLNFNNLFGSESKNTKLSDFQDLDHLNGLALSITNAKLYNPSRDDLVLFYFRNGANYASVYTKSTIVSENIKWNKSIGNKKVMALLVNTRNANAFTGKAGYEGLKKIAEELSNQLNAKQKLDEEKPEKIKVKDIMFGCTGTIGEAFPTEKIKNSISDIVEKIKYNQNKYIWTKAALGIMIKNVANAVSGHQIRVNGINLGWTDTPAEHDIQKKYHKGKNDWLKKAERKVPFKRLTKPIDVARMLAFLCSEESGLMTGSLIDYDQTVVGWHSYSAYDTNILDDSLLGE